VSRGLSAFFDPRSVAIVGASNDPSKWGQWLSRGALKGEHRRAIYLVNRNGGEVMGRTAYRSLAELPEAPELVALAIPVPAFEQAVDDAIAAGAKAIVAITAGLGELGPEGRDRERAVAARVRAGGARLLGPNCLGVFDAGAELELGSNELPGGPVGLISQSGNLALELGLLLGEAGLGFSRFASIGNQADVEVAELVDLLAEHERTHVITIYCEDFRDGREFARAAERARAAGKPVVLLTVGTSAVAIRAARSHTGALVSDLAAVDAGCRAAGIVRVETPKELVDVAQAFLTAARPAGRRIAIVGDGGGQGVIAADVASARGLELPPLSSDLAGRLAAVLPPTASTRNPVDLAGGGEQDFENFERVVRLLLESEEVDAALMTTYFGGYSEYADEFRPREVAVAEGMARVPAETGRPLVVHTMYWRSDPAAALRRAGVPVFREIEAAANALAHLAASVDRPPTGIPDLPPARDGALREGYWEARELLAAAGIPFAEARQVSDSREAAAAADQLGYPVALKALGLEHKSDVGGVALSLADAAELERALGDMEAKLSPAGYSVERMAPVADGVELIAGVRRDRRFGPIVLVGVGGIYAELLRDVGVALAPVDAGEAEALLRSLRAAPVLTGARGRPSVDLGAAARTIATLSEFAAERPAIAEVEINPLLVTPDGALGLDARLVLEKGEDDAS
jgi:acetate---CoA ligase (ADP-forming)